MRLCMWADTFSSANMTTRAATKRTTMAIGQLEDDDHPDVVEQAHRSTSPSTKSRLPRMAMMSGIRHPSSSQGSTERLQNEAERIFTR